MRRPDLKQYCCSSSKDCHHRRVIDRIVHDYNPFSERMKEDRGDSKKACLSVMQNNGQQVRGADSLRAEPFTKDGVRRLCAGSGDVLVQTSKDVLLFSL